MTHFEYFKYCISHGFSSFARAFEMWKDLVVFSDYSKYSLLPEDDPFEQCYLYFWDELDEWPIPKEFLEYLQELMRKVESGEEKLYAFTNFDDLMNDNLPEPKTLKEILAEKDSEK